MVVDNDLYRAVLRKIANVMALNLPDAPGLFNGRMGALIFMCRYAEHVDGTLWEDEADVLLEEVLRSVRGLNDNGLRFGLAGVALGLHYLVTNGLLESTDDMDVLFSSVDDKLAADPMRQEQKKDDGVCNYFPLAHYLVLRLRDGEMNAAKQRLVESSLSVLERIYAYCRPKGSNGNNGLRYTVSVLLLLDCLAGMGLYEERVRLLYDRICDYVKSVADSCRMGPDEIRLLESVCASSRSCGRLAEMVEVLESKRAEAASAVGSATVASTAHRAAEYDPGLLVTPNVDMWEEMMFSRGDRAVSDLCRIDEWVDMQMEEASPEHIGPLIELGLWLVGVKFLPESDASDVSPNIAPGGDSGLAAREAVGVAAGASDVSVTVGTAGYGVEADYAAGSIDSNDSGGVVSSIADGGAGGGVDAGGPELCVGA